MGHAISTGSPPQVGWQLDQGSSARERWLTSLNGATTFAHDLRELIEVLDASRRALTGAAISVAAAAAFYGLYKSVEVMTPKAETGDIACWGINSCKGRSACATAHNACTGQNACRVRVTSTSRWRSAKP